MKTSLLAITILSFSFASLDAATILAQWTFESSPPADLTDSTTIGPLAADSGSGSAYGTHAGTATDWSTPAGNGSANSLSANTWGTGDSFEFRLTTLTFEDVYVYWDQTRSSTGPSAFDMQYSTNGGVSYVTFSSYVVPVNGTPNIAWNATTANPVFSFSADLSALPAVENIADLRIRLTHTGTGIAAGGTNRVDNVIISSGAIPEPSTALLGLLAGLSLIRRRR